MRELTVNKNDAGQRLDKFLTKYLPKMPKGMLYKSLRKNCVKVNGKHIKKGEHILYEGDILNLYLKDEFFETSSFSPVPYKLDIVYEDENILIINKEAGVVVHADDKGTKNTLVDMVLSYLYEKGEYQPDKEHSFSPALANRLDRNTQGLIIAVKNAPALRIINEKIRNREIKKLYLCVCEGKMQGEKTLSAQLKREEKHVTISDDLQDGSKEVQLSYRVLKSTDTKSVLEVELMTGRTHQIRAQLAHIGHPLVGDVKYGAKKINGSYTLISYRLIFDFTGDCGDLAYLKGKEFQLPAGLLHS